MTRCSQSAILGCSAKMGLDLVRPRFFVGCPKEGESEIAKQRDLLEALATKDETAKAAELETEIKARENTVRPWLAPLKDKGYVDGQPNLMGRWRQWVN